WDAIALLKQTLQIPVIGNGDIKSVSEIKSLLDYTSCDAVMIGRAALQNPWIFAGYDADEVPLFLFQEICLEHLSLMKSFYGDTRGCILFRKHAKKYLSHTGLEKHLIRDLLTTSDPDLFTEKFTDSIISTAQLI
ncbi:MAG TPA: tRNA-dihydrouridine synthase, partial [Flexilinea sp.]|nr:tRNA-dihydrouridine synthase [Flexilinea sp.]